MNVFLVGDGPLALELVALVEEAGHTVTACLVDSAADDPFAPFFRTLEELGEIDLALEAAVAEPNLRVSVVLNLDERFGPDLTILTNALNGSVTGIAGHCNHPARVVGYTALPPLAGSTVVELLPALQSGEAAKEEARAFWQSLGREPVEVADSVGGVVPRIVCNLINEAAYALMEGVATPEDIDLAMRLGTNWPRGPLAWADLIGLDQVVAILEALGDEFGPDQYRPAPLLRQLARARRRFYPDSSRELAS